MSEFTKFSFPIHISIFSAYYALSDMGRICGL